MHSLWISKSAFLNVHRVILKKTRYAHTVYIRCIFHFLVCNINSYIYINFQIPLFKKNKLAVYRMKEATRGRLVIINNFLFGDEVDKERMARSQQDATSLDVLFKQLHFQTKQHSNLTLKVQ